MENYYDYYKTIYNNQCRDLLTITKNCMSNNDSILEGVVSYVANPDKGFGFIRSNALKAPMFFHASELKNVMFPELQVGDKVTFMIGSNNRGEQCVNIEKQ